MDKQSDLQAAFKIQLYDWQKTNGEDADYTTQEFYKNYVSQSRALRDEMQRASYEMNLQHQKDLENIYERLSRHEQIPTQPTINTKWQEIVGYRPINTQ